MNILNNNGTVSTTTLADALALYIQATTNLNGSSNDTISITKIDQVVSQLYGSNITIASNSCFLMVQPVNLSASVFPLGASFARGSGGTVVYSANIVNINSLNPSIAAVINNQSLSGVLSINMLIIDKPTMYQNSANSTNNRSIASSVIVGGVQQNGSSSSAMNISLYFKVLPEYQPNISVTYFCSFYDTIHSQWNESGCTQPQYDNITNRYGCSCNHLTTFALTWSPRLISNLTTT